MFTIIMRSTAMLIAAGSAGCAVLPKPLTETEIADFAEDKKARVVADQEPLSGAVHLYEAMARALKYNLDKHVEVMEIALRDRQLRVAHYAMLPEIVSNTGYADRDNYSGGNSVRLLGPRTTGDESLTSSTSSDRDVRSADLQFSWHVLDFGLSYIRAKQAADRVMVAEENKRRVISRIVEKVRAAYWRAVTARRLTHKLVQLEARVRRALVDTQALSAKGDASPLTALTYERELVEIQREVRRIDGDLSTAQAQLAALMNVDPGSKFRVVVPSRQPQPQLLNIGADEMVSRALQNRSELRETAYNNRINDKEAEAAIVEMLPGISLTASPDWNSNQYLFNNHWVSWGARASWNLMKVFSYPDRRAEVAARYDLIDQRALAVTMAIMTQVHVARARLIHARREFRTAKHYNDVQRRIVQQIRAAKAAGKVSEQTAIREEMNGVVARAKLDLAYVELQSAFAKAYSTMGLAPYANLDLSDMNIDKLENELRVGWHRLGDRFH